MQSAKRLGATTLVAALAACATPSEQNFSDNGRDDGLFGRLEVDAFRTPEDQVIADPFEPVNRAIYAFNIRADRYVLEPTAEAYGRYTPRPVRNGVRSFIDNWKSPVWFANDVLQGDFGHASVTGRRFLLNTTFGVAGFYDFAAEHADLRKRDEDFGQTLGVWGVGTGPYVMLPFLGPSTLRDATGRVVDGVLLDPINYANGEDVLEYRIANTASDLVDIRLRTDAVFESAAGSADPYLQARATYVQLRRGKILNSGERTFEDLPEFDDID